MATIREKVNDRKSIVSSSTKEHGSFRASTVSLKISIPAALAIYVLFLLLVYWPVFLGHRFFWEDFFVQEYPIREYCFYMLRWRHVLPFWNPYSWAWAPLLADAQSGFWYPTNLLGILIVGFTQPNAVHFPVLAAETMTLLQFPLAALGSFVLLKKQFNVSSAAALIGGLCWGFGLRMAAEQNHSMQIIQLALLPWETLLLLRAWNSWRYAIGLGLLFGLSFFAGQPQTFFYVGIFFGSYTLSEFLVRRKNAERTWRSVQPLANGLLAIAIALGIAAMQLFPTMELVGRSARAHLNFTDASQTGLHLGLFIDFFVPKYYGEYPGFTVSQGPLVNNHFWYWEATFYWTALGELLALFALVSRWKSRTPSDPQTRHAFFFAMFSVLCLAYGMGRNLYFQWPFWRVLPFFDHIRDPNRMVWFVWFLGTVLTALGLDTLMQEWERLHRYRRFFIWSCGVFLALNLLSISGFFDLAFPPHEVRQGLFLFLLPSTIGSIAASLFLFLAVGNRISLRTAITLCLLIVGVELFYNDFTWHRNTLNPETVVERHSRNPDILEFRAQHATDHAKFVEVSDSVRTMEANFGMFARLPIENASDSNLLLDRNPLRLNDAFPPANDTTRRMEIMGVAQSNWYGKETHYVQYLPFLSLYTHWQVGNEAKTAELLNDSSFDARDTILISEDPKLSKAPIANPSPLPSSATLQLFSENELRIFVHSSRPAILFINDLYYPAWKAAVDGKETNVLRAFTSLRAVPVQAGDHTVRLYYDSAAFDLGWKVSLGSFLVCMLALLFLKKRSS